MKIYISDKEIKSINNTFADVYENSSNGFFKNAVPVKSLEQHEEEIIKQERQKVIAELQKFENEQRLRARKISEEYPTDNEEQKARLYALSSGRFDILEKLKQKLKEMKGENMRENIGLFKAKGNKFEEVRDE